MKSRECNVCFQNFPLFDSFCPNNDEHLSAGLKAVPRIKVSKDKKILLDRDLVIRVFFSLDMPEPFLDRGGLARRVQYRLSPEQGRVVVSELIDEGLLGCRARTTGVTKVGDEFFLTEKGKELARSLISKKLRKVGEFILGDKVNLEESKVKAKAVDVEVALTTDQISKKRLWEILDEGGDEAFELDLSDLNEESVDMNMDMDMKGIDQDEQQ